MERIEPESFQLSSLVEEHLHRYQLAQQYAKGIVIDCACGIGYAAEIFLANPNVTKYFGIDTDVEAITTAKEKNIDKTEFSVGTITNLPFSDNTIDTFTSLETLEHLEQPEQALLEIKRILKNDGVFICSFPTEHYENFCTRIYGPNPYHLQKFTLNHALLKIKQFFNHVYSFIVSQELVSFVHALDCLEHNIADLIHAPNKKYLDGSFLFIASNHPMEVHGDSIYTGMSRIEYDEERLLPVIQAMKFAEHLADERLIAMQFAENLAQERLDAMRFAENLANERLIAMRFAEKLAEERQILILKYENIINSTSNNQQSSNYKYSESQNMAQLFKKGKKK